MENQLEYVIKKLSKLKYVSCIFLFGSHVNDRSREDSDIDIAVLTKNASEKEILNIRGYSNDKIDISIFSKLPIIIQFRILKEGKLLFSRDEKHLYNTKVDVFRQYLDYSVFINHFYRRMLKNV